MSSGAARSQPCGGINSCSFVYIGIAKSKMYFQNKMEILKRRNLREWGVTHFGISEGKGGLKHGSHPWLGMDISGIAQS